MIRGATVAAGRFQPLTAGRVQRRRVPAGWVAIYSVIVIVTILDLMGVKTLGTSIGPIRFSIWRVYLPGFVRVNNIVTSWTTPSQDSPGLSARPF